MLSKGQAKVLRWLRDGEVLRWYSGGGYTEYNTWEPTGEYVSITVVGALAKGRLIEATGMGIFGRQFDWALTADGRQALAEYEETHGTE